MNVAAWLTAPVWFLVVGLIDPVELAWIGQSDFWRSFGRVALLRDYNTRVVVLGVATLGASAGLLGCFTLLRRRALLGDAISHASLPGVALAFLIAVQVGANERSLPLLLLGATISGLVGVVAILWIRNQTRLKEDAALGIVLSVFFGLGVALMSIVQQTESASAAGLEGFIYGKAASMRAVDAQLIAVSSLIAIGLSLLLFKEFKLLCFDEGFAGSRGYPVRLLDVGLMALVVLITIVGLQVVGLVLIIAMMVTPAAAARFWTEKMWQMLFWAAAIGAIGSVAGAMLSAVFPDLPSGAMVVLACAGMFMISMLLGRRRGVLVRWFRRRRLNARVDRQHLLRAIYELIEPSLAANGIGPQIDVSREVLFGKRSWSRRRLGHAIDEAESDDLVREDSDRVRLTQLGYNEAARLTRQHRMWELYLITYADVAPANVDRDADDIEHVLAPEVIDQLEDLLDAQRVSVPVPTDPHSATPASGIPLGKDTSSQQPPQSEESR
ncbi:MAG: iron chelate uptake ABC transporter family permease subunit [Planctomycetota bacterium]